MDMEQEEMQFVGFFGIFGEAYKLVTSRRRIFSQIALSLVLPLSLLLLVHSEISDKLVNNIVNDQIVTRKATEHILSEYAHLFLFKAVYFTLLLVLSLLSTAAVVYTIASAYTARNDLSYAEVMTVVPKVWKRLIVTFLWTALAFFAYNVVAFAVLLALFAALVGSHYSASVLVLLFAYVAVYALGVLYLSLIWQLASVVSVLEEARGIGAMRKSKALMKGKMRTSFFVFGALVVLSFALQFAFQTLVVHGSENARAIRVLYGLLCLLVSVKIVLLGLVVQTILYFVCKSYHRENIDKSALSDHLQGYLGEYVPLTAKDVQLEKYHV